MEQHIKTVSGKLHIYPTALFKRTVNILVSTKFTGGGKGKIKFCYANKTMALEMTMTPVVFFFLTMVPLYCSANPFILLSLGYLLDKLDFT